MQPEYRIYEMNKRLASRPEQQQLNDTNELSIWYEAFVNEFFDDTAKLSIRNVVDENVSRNFTLSRSLVPRFFRSFGEGGVNDLYFHFTRGQTTILQRDLATQSQTIIFESDACTMISNHGRPMFAKICTEGNLLIEFIVPLQVVSTPTTATPTAGSASSGDVNDSNANTVVSGTPRIKNWIFSIRRHQELIPRSTIPLLQQDPSLMDQLTKNITKTGITVQTFNYLKLCSILEPMQDLMIRHKLTGQPPKECLRNAVVQRVNLMRNNGVPGNMLNTQQQIPVNQQQPFQRSVSLLSNEDVKVDSKPQISGSNQSPQNPTSQGTSSSTHFYYIFLIAYIILWIESFISIKKISLF